MDGQVRKGHPSHGGFSHMKMRCKSHIYICIYIYWMLGYFHMLYIYYHNILYISVSVYIYTSDPIYTYICILHNHWFMLNPRSFNHHASEMGDYLTLRYYFLAVAWWQVSGNRPFRIAGGRINSTGCGSWQWQRSLVSMNEILSFVDDQPIEPG